MASPQALNMSHLPPVFIIPTHLPADDLHEIEDTLYHAGGRLSYRASEARIFLGKVLHKKRAAFDLRARGLWTKEEPLPEEEVSSKRQKLDHGAHDKRKHSSKDDTDEAVTSASKRKRSVDGQERLFPDLSNHIMVLKVEWLDDCVKKDAILPFTPYLVYSGKIVEKPANEKQTEPTKDRITYIKAIPESTIQTSGSSSRLRDTTGNTSSILERAKAEAASEASKSQHPVPFHRRKFGHKSTSPTQSHPPRLHRTTTSEMGAGDVSKLPPIPSWMNAPHPQPMYSCLRNTPPLENNPNRYFINQLMKIKEARLLNLDEIGVRAYSTSIASISAYPHRITSPLEITRLPGCSDKIASLWIEWHDSISLSDKDPTSPPSSPAKSDASTVSIDASPANDASLDPKRTMSTVLELENDKTLQHLRTFHQIWGVGPETARKFHLTNHWTDLDDVVEQGWSSLNRVQQIGVKFYDEFQRTIPRSEVEGIARTILRHARTIKGVDESYWTNDVVTGHNGADATCPGDPRDFVAVIVGGYRRGKPESGDVDIILSHRDDRLTQDLVVDVVASLESEGFITHTLTLHTTTSDRGQQTLPYRFDHAGHGFDSLDKALCVWQDPKYDPESPEALAKGGKNPNVHRRVDIIVSSWRTVGCAVLGWSGGTTFQRDIRRWVKRERGWKFDSSGVRDRGNGLVLELEGPREGDGSGDGSDGWEDRERRLMEGLGIGWRRAGDRCTG